MKNTGIKKNNIINRLACAALAVAMCGSHGMAAVVFSDDFNSGTSGSNLNGQAVGYYEPSAYASTPTWNATVTSTAAAAIYSATTSGVVSARNSGATSTIRGYVSVADQTTGTLTLQADIRLGNSSWIGIGFLNGIDWFSTNNTSFCTIGSTGKISTYENGTSTVLGTSSIAGFSTLTTYTLKLVYDIDASTVSTYLNGAFVKTYTLTALNSSIINNVGFYFFNDANATADSGQIDNFIYSASAIPEPSIVALLAWFGLIYAGRYGRRSALKLAVRS